MTLPDFNVIPGMTVSIPHLHEDRYPPVWTATGLPHGLTIDAATGEIWGTTPTFGGDAGNDSVEVVRTQRCTIGSGGPIAL
jgi:hypothetical protein